MTWPMGTCFVLGVLRLELNKSLGVEDFAALVLTNLLCLLPVYVLILNNSIVVRIYPKNQP